jgi:CrcB protein
MELIAIFIGGALGAGLRYCITLLFANSSTPYLSTFLVNMVGCFIIGFSSYLFAKRVNNFSICIKSLLTIGLAGGLTTFSTFVYDLYYLILQSNLWVMFIYLFLSLFLGLFLVSMGVNTAYTLLVAIIKSRKKRSV